ncbi:glycosyltransferase family 1 protein [Paenibacillus sp. FSL H8-0548]|uniref:glycosyltransferase family 4 protein n=1 Tax=Paenibacillus sp. FSL H8-0548 TaxID=1920422 RepID=UPI00096C6F0B|nr:glycosyltransferase family 4 protein [Paenibacillus sp. FSL H8-0548]OMF35953.1 glycosyltransferase family 1 protein [Paenibacillus sp. FSL H8-0548]
MPNKILFCATVDYHFKAFHLPMMEWFKQQGWEVHVAAKGELDLPFVDKKFNLPIERSPIHLQNIKAYQELKQIIKQQKYSIIHCHTPMGGVLARLAAQSARKTGTKVIYTAHGFHFCKGASLLNWSVYYPIEKMLSSLTDCLITINEEDYELAVSRGFKAKEIAHVHGVGVNAIRFKPVQKIEKWRLRQEYEYRTDDILLFYAAEFNKNKNHELLLHALALIKDQVPSTKLLLAGKGPLLESTQLLASRLGLDHMVHFLGFRNDIDRLLPMSDIAVASSLREGLPVNIMEAMSCGLPIVATQNRGHSELIVEGENGFVLAPSDTDLFAIRMKQLIESAELRQQMGMSSMQRMKMYNSLQVEQELGGIYKSYMLEEQNEAESQYRRAYI